MVYRRLLNTIMNIKPKNITTTLCWRRSFFRTINPDDIKQKGDVYQFGVFDGSSMRVIAQELCNLNIPINNFFGFDVFTGMPEEEGEELMNEDWAPGNFNLVKHGKRFGIKSDNVDDIVQEIEKSIENIFFINNMPIPNVRIFAGLVQETLTEDLLQHFTIKEASYVDVDFDLYSSSKYGLSELLRHNIITRDTLVGYDDWGGKPGYNKFETGESRAHQEVFEANNINTNLIFHTAAGEGSCQSNLVKNVVDVDTYRTKGKMVKLGNPDWKWGDVEDIQAVWVVDSKRTVKVTHIESDLRNRLGERLMKSSN